MLGTLTSAGWARLSRSEVEAALYTAAVQAGLAQDRNCGPRGIENTIQSGLDAGERRPRPEPR